MRIRFLALAAGLAALAPLALHAEPGAVQSAPTAAPQPASNAVTCNYLYHEGVVIPHPVCLTRTQWERRRLEIQRDIREFQIKTLTTN